MVERSGPPEGQAFWDAEKHTSRTIRDVRVDVFTGATGRASLRFESHTICLLESSAVGIVSVDGGEPRHVEHAAHSLIFVPKGVHLAAEPIGPIDITVFVIPEHWFERAKQLGTGLDDCHFEYFKADWDTVLAQAAALLKAIALEKPRMALPPLVDALINSIVTRLLRILCSGPERQDLAKSGPIPERDLALIEVFVDRHIGRAIRATELAELVGLTPSAFSRGFKAATGETPMRYMLTRRIEVAKIQLGNHRQSLVDVALYCGFSSQSHFTTAFRQLTGMTPARYREQLKKNSTLKTVLYAVLFKAILQWQYLVELYVAA